MLALICQDTDVNHDSSNKPRLMATLDVHPGSLTPKGSQTHREHPHTLSSMVSVSLGRRDLRQLPARRCNSEEGGSRAGYWEQVSGAEWPKGRVCKKGKKGGC